MNKKAFKPIRSTELGLLVLRLRLSLREDKNQFGKRLHVHRKTVTFWEHGGSTQCLPVYKTMLDQLHQKLKEAKMLIPLEVAQLEMAKLIEAHGDKDDLDIELDRSEDLRKPDPRKYDNT